MVTINAAAVKPNIHFVLLLIPFVLFCYLEFFGSQGRFALLAACTM
jgi:hypothetical protein